jgi:hypothetical protein
MSVFGAYYALAPGAAAGRLALIHLALHSTAVLVLVPGIVLAITETGEGAAKIGSVLAVLSGLVFLVQVARVPWRMTPGRAGQDPANGSSG